MKHINVFLINICEFYWHDFLLFNDIVKITIQIDRLTPHKS